ncbi:Gfo/Idh/MocA family protein [Pseudoxanthomonas sp. UTMC 1351]|uniref:Gfo/Idh/MocA family protein n=1 Tax=Pseudoxanthomonas sp. UTMC 1351 TaxID=2695853 RepID=UPI0034CFB669
MPPVTRRDFLAAAAAAGVLATPFGAAVAAPRVRRLGPNDRLNIAMIGVGGVGGSAINALRDENIIAFCDVDEVQANKQFQRTAEKDPEGWARMKDARRFNDYRRMFDALAKRIDAVVISTPDHMHFPAAMTALALGKHVYCQKPLTHTVWEARELTRAARKAGVVTQMGNQGHAGEGCRRLREWVQAGVLGEVREIYSWTDRPGNFWPAVKTRPDHSKGAPPVPATLNWDAWLGVAPPRPYDPAYTPSKWRGWWDFGTGPLGDVGCHIMDGAYWALDLGAPDAVEAMVAGATAEGTATASVVTFHFPQRGALPAVKYVWSDGGIQPVLPPEIEIGRMLDQEAGTLVVGSKATALCSFYYDDVRIVPEAKAQQIALPAPSIPRVLGGPFVEWARACKGGPTPGSHFDYAGPFTETVLLGVLAQRMQRRLEWDAKALRVSNVPEANGYLNKEYRPGWF